MSSARKKSHSGIYHVMVRGVNKEPIFQNREMKRAARYYIRESAKLSKVKIYSYCIMDNHIHLLPQADDLKELSEFMARWEIEYAKYYNLQKGRSGYVFQGRYRSEIIDDELYFWTCLRYIHRNPVKANYTSQICEYEFSSAWEFAKGIHILLSEQMHFFYQKRCPDIAAFKKFHLEELENIVFCDTKEDRMLREDEIAESIYQHMIEKNKQKEEVWKNITVKRRALLNELIKTGKFSRYRAEKICDRQPWLKE